MHIAVITPAYNVAPYLGTAIRSVVAQTHRDWSMIVVDDGSTDTTADIAAGFTDPRLRLIRQGRAGVSAARNRGVNAAGRCDAFLFLDGDDWLAPTAMMELAQTLTDSPWAVAACGRFARVGIDGSIRHSGAPPEGALLGQLLIRNLFANGGHVLVAAEAKEAAGEFRTDLCYGEDWEFWTRLAILGEYAALRTRSPLLYLRERPASACFTCATDPACYSRALDVIYANPVIRTRLGSRRLTALRSAADAESAWAVGRALIRHGRYPEARRWLLRSAISRPTLKRFCLVAVVSSGFQIFPYGFPPSHRKESGFAPALRPE
ncbi:MAG TPA: glycosyltransferase family 2 protein [Rhodopila sp.]|nr:glycosyltransferase family 2 protein [Rhodopila sp.]